MSAPSHRRSASLITVFLCAAAVLGWLAWPTTPGPAIAHTGTGSYVVTVTAESPRLGSTDVEMILTHRQSSTNPTPIRAVAVQAVMPLMGYAAPPANAVPLSADHYRAAGIPLMMTGPWQLLIGIDSADGTDRLTLPLWVSG